MSNDWNEKQFERQQREQQANDRREQQANDQLRHYITQSHISSMFPPNTHSSGSPPQKEMSWKGVALLSLAAIAAALLKQGTKQQPVVNQMSEPTAPDGTAFPKNVCGHCQTPCKPTHRFCGQCGEPLAESLE